MPLFVPILRILMLFLNVYDSYKTLKDPPPSSRNDGRPSVRAVSQRKRDMKGCLAVWIVWASLSMYERTVENIVYLFIPFYDEFKCLALLFLILTRARGAEPIYLHLIRPLIKPYTRTLDALLELMLQIGDFIFALSTYPVRLGLELYRTRFGPYEENFETERETQSDSSNDVDTSELPTSFLASSGAAPAPMDSANPENELLQFPRKSSHDKAPVESPSRRPSSDALRGVARKKPETTDNLGLEPNFFDSTRAGESLLRPSASVSRKNTRTFPDQGSSRGNGNLNNLEPNFFKPSSQREDEGSRHQVWYPPKSSYVDDDLDGQPDLTTRPKDADQAALLAHEQQQYEEWRQYPAFPSAYPSTPLVTTSRLVPAAALVASSLDPAIEEEEKNQQDFHKSLLPPREPLNPSHAGDLSDKHKLFGITSSSPDIDDADGSMSADEYEDEDAFNFTLRTPLPPLGSLRSQIQPRRLISVASASSAVSVPSRSSALTTADNGSEMQIDSSSDSSLSAPKPNTSSPSVIGKKRSYPRTKAPSIHHRVRQIESETSQDVSESDQDVQQVAATLKTEVRKTTSPSSHPKSAQDDSAAPFGNTSSARERQDQVPPEEKRRKIVRSALPPRTVNPSRPVRPRVARYASPPPQSQKGKLRDLSGAPNKRSSVRLRSGPSAGKVKENDGPSSVSASSSASVGDLPPPPVPPKPSKQDITKKRT